MERRDYMPPPLSLVDKMKLLQDQLNKDMGIIDLWAVKQKTNMPLLKSTGNPNTSVWSDDGEPLDIPEDVLTAIKVTALIQCRNTRFSTLCSQLALQHNLLVDTVGKAIRRFAQEDDRVRFETPLGVGVWQQLSGSYQYSFALPTASILVKDPTKTLKLIPDAPQP